MTRFKLDLHEHTSDFHHLVFFEINKKEYLVELLSKLFKKGNNLVIGIADFNDDGRFNKLIKVVGLLPKEYEVKKNLPIISITKNNKTIYFIRACEISTEKGHILIVGNNIPIKSRKLERVLEKAKKNKWIVIAAHPLHYLLLPYFLIAKLVEPEPIVSLQDKTILENKNKFDSLELSSYLPKDRRNIKYFGKKYKIPVISESDAHFLNEFFDSYFELDNLDMKNINTFKRTFRKSLRKHIQLHPTKRYFMAKYKHGINIIFDYIGIKLGLIKD